MVLELFGPDQRRPELSDRQADGRGHGGSYSSKWLVIVQVQNLWKVFWAEGLPDETFCGSHGGEAV